MSPARHPGLERLDDYVTGVLGDDDAAALEEEMFAAVGSGVSLADDTRFFDRAHRLLEWLGAHNGFAGGFTAEQVEALKAQGVRVHVVEFSGTGGKFEVGPWPEDAQVVVLYNTLDMRPYEDIEFECENPDGTPVKTFRGCIPDPATGNLYAICAAPLARMAYVQRPRVSRITGVRNGKREVVAVFETFPAAPR